MKTDTKKTDAPAVKEAEELAELNAQVIEAEGHLSAAERGLTLASHGNASLDGPLRAVEDAQARLTLLVSRRDRAVILGDFRGKQEARAQAAREQHAAAAKKNAAAIKREREQLNQSAQEAAQAVLDAVQATRDAINALRLHSVGVKAAAGRMAALDLPLSDEHNAYDTGAEVVRGNAVVKFDGVAHSTILGPDLHGVVDWIRIRAERAELFGRSEGAHLLKRLDAPLSDRLRGKA